MAVTITVRMEEDLRDRIDEARGPVPREAWIRNVIEATLAEDEPREDVPPVRSAYLTGHPGSVVSSDQVPRRPPGQRKGR